MDKKVSKSINVNNFPGIGLVFGTAIGAGIGMIINIDLMPIAAGVGCAIGLIMGAAIASYAKKQECAK